MSRISHSMLFVGILSAAGCTRTEDYVAVAREQQEAMREVSQILSRVHSEKDLAAAKADLDERRERFEAIPKKANALPKPPPADAVARLEQERFFFQRTLEEMTAEIQRVKALP